MRAGSRRGRRWCAVTVEVATELLEQELTITLSAALQENRQKLTGVVERQFVVVGFVVVLVVLIDV